MGSKRKTVGHMLDLCLTVYIYIVQCVLHSLEVVPASGRNEQIGVASFFFTSLFPPFNCCYQTFETFQTLTNMSTCINFKIRLHSAKRCGSCHPAQFHLAANRHKCCQTKTAHSLQLSTREQTNKLVLETLLATGAEQAHISLLSAVNVFVGLFSSAQELFIK